MSGRRRVVLSGEVEGLRQKVEERDSEHGARAEAEDQVKLVLVSESEASAQQRCDQSRETKGESHIGRQDATSRHLLQVTCNK